MVLQKNENDYIMHKSKNAECMWLVLHLKLQRIKSIAVNQKYLVFPNEPELRKTMKKNNCRPLPHLHIMHSDACLQAWKTFH